MSNDIPERCDKMRLGYIDVARGIGIFFALLSEQAIPKRIGRPVAFVGRNPAVFFALGFATFPFVAKALGILVPGYRHFRVAERTDLWQSLVAVAAQLAVLSALAPFVGHALSRFRTAAAFGNTGGQKEESR